KIRVIDPNILRKLKLAHEACTQNESCNATVNTVLGPTFCQGRSVGRTTADHSSSLNVHRRVPRIHSPDMRSKGNGIPLCVHFRVIEVVVTLVISTKCRIVLLGRQNERSAAPPASHQLRRHQLLALGCWSAMLSQKVAESANMLLQSA